MPVTLSQAAEDSDECSLSRNPRSGPLRSPQFRVVSKKRYFFRFVLSLHLAVLSLTLFFYSFCLFCLAQFCMAFAVSLAKLTEPQ